MSTDARARFSSMVRDWARQFAAEQGLAHDRIALPSDFVVAEVVGFLRAFDHEIVTVSSTGRCLLPRIHRATRKPTEPCLFSVRKRDKVVYFAWREYVTQVGALADLVLDYGWPIELVALDPRDWTFDVAAFSSTAKDARMIVAVETKKNTRELDALLAQMSAAAPSRSDGAKKYEGLRKEKPLYFWAVAPGVRRAFCVEYDGSGATLKATLKAIPDLPAYGDIRG